MGWLSMQSMGRFTTPKQYLDNQFTYTQEHHSLAVLKSSMVGSVYYAACKFTAGPRAGGVFAIICLTRHTPKARDGYVFGYKDMDETVGPCEEKCPVSILDLLTPTESEWANKWRANCRAYHAAKPKAKGLAVGMTIKLAAPLKFTTGEELDTFKLVENMGRRGWRVTSPAGIYTYRMRGLATMDFTVLGELI
jgi:hypothetical protein